jgi:hypothetical protein
MAIPGISSAAAAPPSATARFELNPQGSSLAPAAAKPVLVAQRPGVIVYDNRDPMAKQGFIETIRNTLANLDGDISKSYGWQRTQDANGQLVRTYSFGGSFAGQEGQVSLNVSQGRDGLWSGSVLFYPANPNAPIHALRYKGSVSDPDMAAADMVGALTDGNAAAFR